MVSFCSFLEIMVSVFILVYKAIASPCITEPTTHLIVYSLMIMMEKIPSSLSTITVFLVLIFSSLIIAAETNNITTDQQALLAFKAHITHDPSNLLSKNWTSNISVCNWIGITCDFSTHRVAALNISFLNLTGTIPSQLGNLSSLQTLDLSYNQFSGAIPSSIFSISTLELLDFSNNQFSDSLPSFGNMPSLLAIDLKLNRLTGELPANICNYLPHLGHLFLSGNMFHGEIPSTLSNCKQLQSLSLSVNYFSGVIPKEIGNLTKLKELHLGHNKLQGEIPQELGNLAELEWLSLPNNSLTGIIPEDMCRSHPHLKRMVIFRNQFIGQLPHNLRQCRELLELDLSHNQFIGRLPKDIGNLTSLEELYLGFNNLIGEIPHEIGNLRSLFALEIEENNLVGIVPDAIFNLSSLKYFDLTNNNLRGSLPSSMDLGLPNLEQLALGLNNFSGSIPSIIFNASKLTFLELGQNYFSGFIPTTIGNLIYLDNLRLSNNYLTSSTPELSFLSSLTNCKNLRVIGLSENPSLAGILPSSIGNLSISMEQIFIDHCNISGNIPKETGNLRNLIVLNLEANKLTGSIPITFGRLHNLQSLSLAYNKLEGSIPNDFCHLPRLFQLHLDGNKLSGNIPACLGNLFTLRMLTLSSNELTSVIPSTFWKLKDIMQFNLSSNSLTGTLPLDIENWKVVVEIDLSRNNLSGDIPTTIGGLKLLKNLSLAYNRLHGSIPKSFGDLISLESLDLSDNNLSGVIPMSFEKLSDLKYLNLSFNRLEGKIPTEGSFANFSIESFIGNDLLCGSPNLQVPPCKSKTHRKSRTRVLLLGIILPLSIALTTVVILAVRYVLVTRYRKRSKELPDDANMSSKATRRRFSYLELLRATNGFNENNLIGKGSFGSVFKARLQDEMEVAVKVFHQQSERALESFDAECEVMKSLRHRNLLKIISSCSNNDFKALILEYMPNGSLEERLHSSNSNLDIFQRLNIMIDVASALEYLHFGYTIPIVHCDLKPSNVLLDENMVAHLSDFGIAKLLSGEDQSMTRTQTLATIGYMAPEYGREGQVSIKGDIYSYGIMLMETFTKKKPTDEIFAGELNLKHWVNDSLPNLVIEVVDPNLLSREDRHFTVKELCVSSILNLAMKCTVESPEGRIKTNDIVSGLLKIRDTLLRNIEGRRVRRQI